MKQLFIALILACLRSSALGVEPIVIDSKDTGPYTSVAEKAWIMEDQKHLITVNDLLTNPDKYAGQFKKIKTEVTNLNFTTSSFWIHFIIKNGLNENRNFILEAARPITNTADLYILTGSGCDTCVGIKRSGDGIPFNLREAKHRKSLKLQQGDMIYLCSDGYKDQFGGEIGKKFMSKRFKQLLLGICSKSLNEQSAVLDKTISEWIGNGEQVDDILVIGIKV